ncbi:MAG: 5'-3' exonuclease H3TH domain-containing protein [Candidatus Phytoplasma stylosanthis]|uniref:5'-3' exonuclease n=1 Tax=Candidatus Phytoplasma stylosanthis TaxID=2798314 RepID=UPI00293A5548|nr:5'-3' exonuclease H3TH domain-containing protein [Candidatus Phytoplasma stylosanthis]MDV3167920.1 5'-3' exonuclease H3TH domain-containing protein [Candidatus Phytoplasma stylosanthis]MDV3170755.1 5'-3' exonuclease H3TH domain-containing protein [Candidatus Phytoplasma stylosanthis]MDV3173722.1 5'-3' exonuclease H3TH domain-containing protein [Candidatus Phytoplasma stylosanthis]MDV3174012.1 5'-3' exonuclease H3TH domain-containing protein [Candidatus Phytoplasma stylosanthis]MDV3202576.1 
MRKLVLVDGNSLVFRAYYATYYKNDNLIQNSEKKDVNALIIFVNMFRKILEKTENYICVAFDSKYKTLRHELYKDYKKSRIKTPDSLINQIFLIKEYLSLLGIKHFSKDGYEADDIIGTIAQQASQNNISVLIFSSDKDFLQLINNNICVALIKQGLKNVVYYDEKNLEDKYFLRAHQIVDFKSIVGDSSDNIQGIPSIGPKTAIKLLNQFDNLENIFDNLWKINSKIKDKFIQFRDKVFFNRFLITINKLVPLSFDYKDTQIQKPKIELLKQFWIKNKFKK